MLIRFPVQLPPNFLTELGCGTSYTQFVAFHYDKAGELLVCENGITIKPCKKKNAWMYNTFSLYPPVVDWLDRNDVQLATAWLIYDYETHKCYIANAVEAIQFIKNQKLPKEIKNGKSSTNSSRATVRRGKQA